MDSQNKKDIVLHELENAHSCLREGEYLLDGSFFNAAITRLYYACFHAASGLLITSGFVVFTHSGVRTLLGKEFIQTGKLDIVWGDSTLNYSTNGRTEIMQLSSISPAKR